MEYSLLNRDQDKQVIFYGNILPSSRDKFLELMTYLPTSEQKRWVLQVDDLDYIDSAGLGMLIELNETAQKHGVALVLSGANKVVKRMFDLSRFNELFEIID